MTLDAIETAADKGLDMDAKHMADEEEIDREA